MIHRDFHNKHRLSNAAPEKGEKKGARRKSRVPRSSAVARECVQAEIVVFTGRRRKINIKGGMSRCEARKYAKGNIGAKERANGGFATLPTEPSKKLCQQEYANPVGRMRILLVALPLTLIAKDVQSAPLTIGDFDARTRREHRAQCPRERAPLSFSRRSGSLSFYWLFDEGD